MPGLNTVNKGFTKMIEQDTLYTMHEINQSTNFEKINIKIPEKSISQQCFDPKAEIPIEELGYSRKFQLISVLSSINGYRILSLLSSFVFIACILSSMTLFYLNKQKQPNLLLNILFKDNYSPFQSHKYALTSYLILLCIMTISFIVALFKNDYSFKCTFREDLALHFPFILLFLSSAFIIGIVLNKTLITSIIQSSLYSGSFIMLIFVYRKSKMRKNQKLIALINESFLISVITCFVCYLVLYSICDYITMNKDSLEYKRNTDIIFNCIYACIGLALLTSFKDIIFPICLLIIEGGLLVYEKSFKYKDNLSVVIIIAFMLISIILTVVKFKKKVFGYDKDADAIISNSKKSCNV